MHALAAGPPPGIQEELLPLLITIENPLQVSMRKEHSPAEKDVRRTSREFLEASEQFRRNATGTKVSNELFVVDRDDLSVDHRSLDAERVDILFLVGGERNILGEEIGNCEHFWLGG